MTCCNRAKVLAGTLMCPRHGSVFDEPIRPTRKTAPRTPRRRPKADSTHGDDLLCDGLVAMLTKLRDDGYRIEEDDDDELCSKLVAVLRRIKETPDA